MVHGWVYFIYVLAAFNLAIKVRWPIAKTIGVLLAGTIPLLGIIVEHFQTQRRQGALRVDEHEREAARWTSEAGSARRRQFARAALSAWAPLRARDRGVTPHLFRPDVNSAAVQIVAVRYEHRVVAEPPFSPGLPCDYPGPLAPHDDFTRGRHQRTGPYERRAASLIGHSYNCANSNAVLAASSPCVPDQRADNTPGMPLTRPTSNPESSATSATRSRRIRPGP